MAPQQPFFTKKVSVCKTFTFDSAHKLEEYIGKCANLHGHTYRLEVEVKGRSDVHGLVIDFGDIKRIVNEQIIAKYDHQFLNDHFPFNTTAENLVVFFFEVIHRQLELEDSSKQQSLTLERLRLWETPTAYAEINREDFLDES